MENDREILKVENLCNYYKANRIGFKQNKTQVLHNINFHINKKEFFGLVGESGSGKSTLCKALLGLIEYEGRININGIEPKKAKRKEIARLIQAVFQDPATALDPRKKIGFLLEEPLKIHHIGTKREREKRVKEVLEQIGLDESYLGRFPHELSGGQRQRVCIGCALILNPGLILADEAVASLDVSIGAQILNLLQDLHEVYDLSFLFVSHNLNLVYFLCDRIAVMYRGKIIEMGDAEDIYNHPLHPYTRLLLTCALQMDTDCHEVSGMITDKEAVITGCDFYHHCTDAEEECKTIGYRLVDVSIEGGKKHYVSCLHSYLA